MPRYNIKPKKSLGQHFLKDSDIAERIASTLSAYDELPVVEVGAGTGALTRFLVEKGYRLSIVELDREAVALLRRLFPDMAERIAEADFLRMRPEELPEGRFCIIGNYPYNISTQIFFKLIELRERVPCCSGMLQKEVAERLASPPGRKAYGILSVLLQAWYDVEYLFTVDETVFDPPPKVKSAVIRATRNARTELGCDEAQMKRVVKTAFNQRRKTLRNSLKPLLGNDFPHYAEPVFDRRPEQLSVEEFVALTTMIEGCR
ncbi:MAG: 16S rRNA (adenine(1518)-N(6)/adenine(1519)-N(6))-dimethyltransferase RsmA [Tannerellaceae bacterium]|jgi:16S rRNA (adenine1518-N6/adenine1519-N6)-dimethyltransferase|nr:16S rRNA (adenine(1518)-N(6)/adenine(1519)-N(6))-dimethyltransferase RsmA [Tannerellaceae bacterium]